MELAFESPEKAVEYANQVLTTPGREEEIPKALQVFEWFLSQEPDNHTLLFAVSSCFMRMGNMGIAEALLKQAINVKPDFHEAMNNLGFIRQSKGEHDTSVEWFEKANAIEPNNAEYVGNLSTQYINAGDPTKCIEYCNRALELNPSAHDPMWNRGLAYLELGRFREGWQGYRQGLHAKITSSQHRKRRHYGEEDKHPYWDGSPGQNVVFYGEQGVGDEILAASMLDDAIRDCKQVIFECHPRLVEIFRHSFGDRIPVYGTRKVPWKDLEFPKWTEIDAKCAIFDLGGFYRNEESDFPRRVYLKPFEDKVAKYRDQLAEMSDRPKIGIGWKGGNDLTRRDLRSIPLPLWTDIFQNVDADFISLQYDPADRMGWNTGIVEGFNKDFGAPNGYTFHHWPDVINDLDECYGGLIHALDLVICINTSLVHACGAMGVDCWTLTPNKPAWRYNVPGALKTIPDDEMIWYGPHVQQLRQPPGDDGWEEVLDQIKRQLDLLYPGVVKVAV